MGRQLLYKLLAIAGITLLLLLALALIKGKIGEREARHDGVAREIAESLVRPQLIRGPILVLPCTQTVLVKTTDNNGRETSTEESRDCSLHFAPTQLTLNAHSRHNVLARGIYQVPTHAVSLQWGGRFQLPEHQDSEDTRWGRPYLALPISDPRGLMETPSLRVDGQALTFAVGSGLSADQPGLNADLANDLPGEHQFNLSLQLRTTQQFQLVPTGQDSRIDWSSDWAHPSFIGRFLPVDRHIRADGFNARWQVNQFASNIDRLLARCPSLDCDGLEVPTLGVAFVDPVDVYLQSYRAAEYGLLFIGIAFAMFFLFEVLKGLNLHPMQYALTGLSLALFFLLLFSAAEHVPFAVAYAASAGACVGLNSYYAAHCLGGWRRAAGFGVTLSAVYGFLYVVLSSEDFALLFGAVLLFSLLAAAMVLTRKLDWATLGRRIAVPAP